MHKGRYWHNSLLLLCREQELITTARTLAKAKVYIPKQKHWVLRPKGNIIKKYQIQCFLIVFSVVSLVVILSSRISYSSPTSLTNNFKVIKIKKGDTLYRICKKHYGKFSKTLVNLILSINADIKNKNLIIAGTRIRLPIVEKVDLDDDTSSIKKDDKPFVKKQDKKEKTVYQESFKPIPSDKTIPSEPIPSFVPSDVVYEQYPPPVPGRITSLRWLGDNRAIVKGNIELHDRKIFSGQFFVFVPGDIEYKQSDLKIVNDKFHVEAIIGRNGRDYNKQFVLKLALLNQFGDRIGEIRQTIVKYRHKVTEEIQFKKSSHATYSAHLAGWNGIEKWLDIQETPAMETHNFPFKVPGGVVIPNYRYISYNPDEKYLSWYGRITLYGSSCIAKALLLNNEIERAEAILKVWAAQIDKKGRVPRSANVIGDNYTSPDVRSGETAHFLGAIAMARAVSGHQVWELHMKNIINNYFIPLISRNTGLVQGGYDGNSSSGYEKPSGYKIVEWFSAEHNFDLYQTLIFISKISDLNLSFRNQCTELAGRIATGIDKYFWNEKEGTFNRGWRQATGNDEAKALDCASWGALYLLKKLRLAREQNDNDLVAECAKRAGRCLRYAETHFKTRWHYKTKTGRKGSIEGFRPYDGVIDDIVWEDGLDKGERINWDVLKDMVWSEGTLGVAKAWESYALLLDDKNAKIRSREIYNEMITMQSLSDQGGLLYSSKQIKGHFTVGEELASLGWLGYLTLTHEKGKTNQFGNLNEWIPW